jgi:hypothetical protein
MLITGRNSSRCSSASGTTLAQFPLTLWLVFVIMGFPMIIFGSIGLRYVFLINAARAAASAASQCNSFQTDISPTDRSAVNIGNQFVAQITNAFTGITVQKTTVSILICNLQNQNLSLQSVPLTQPANPSANLYDVEVAVQGQIQPLFSMPINIFGQIPGLSAPITTSTRSIAMFENTQGLTQ